MKKIVVMSDNHGNQTSMKKVKELESDADYYIHCGDSEARRQDDLRGWICVAGNNDWGLDLPKESILEIEGRRIFITHGQFFGYFNREEKMLYTLEENDCTVLLSGHTHMPMAYNEDNYYLINPGSTDLPRGGSHRSYAVIYMDKDNIEVQFKELEK
jgi:hypothetical protein